MCLVYADMRMADMIRIMAVQRSSASVRAEKSGGCVWLSSLRLPQSPECILSASAGSRVC